MDLNISSRTIIHSRATAFQNAIIRSGGGGLIGLQEFPSGACGDSSILLGQFLFDEGFGEWTYVVGERTVPSGQQSHAWIENNQLIVDITAHQFEDIIEPVVTTVDRVWHSQFVDQKRHVALIDVYNDGFTLGKLSKAYLLILASMDVQTP